MATSDLLSRVLSDANSKQNSILVVDRRAEILTIHLLNTKQRERTSKLRDVTQCACALIRVYQNSMYQKP